MGLKPSLHDRINDRLNPPPVRPNVPEGVQLPLQNSVRRQTAIPNTPQLQLKPQPLPQLQPKGELPYAPPKGQVKLIPNLKPMPPATQPLPKSAKAPRPAPIDPDTGRPKQNTGLRNSTLEWMVPELACMALGLCEKNKDLPIPVPNPPPFNGGQQVGRLYFVTTTVEWEQQVNGIWTPFSRNGFNAILTGAIQSPGARIASLGFYTGFIFSVIHAVGTALQTRIDLDTFPFVQGLRFLRWSLKAIPLDGWPDLDLDPPVDPNLEGLFLTPGFSDPPQFFIPPIPEKFPPPIVPPQKQKKRKDEPQPVRIPFPPPVRPPGDDPRTEKRPEDEKRYLPPTLPLQPPQTTPLEPGLPQEWRLPPIFPPTPPILCPPYCLTQVNCRFQPIKLVPVLVREFLGCVPVINTPRYGTRIVQAIEGTESQTQALFERLAFLEGAQCNGLEQWLGVLRDKIQELINAPPGNEEPPIELPYSTVDVPIVTCSGSGIVESFMKISVLKGTEVSVVQQFSELARLRKEQCRIYEILGGDRWFPSNAQSSGFDIELEASITKFQALSGVGDGADNPTPISDFVDLIAAMNVPTFGRMGLHTLPGELPETLLAYTDSKSPISVENYLAFFEWYIKQFDALVGKFPIEIVIEDIDPLTQGNQTKKVELPNISEALAELYGAGITSSVNSDISINFLMRLAAEIIATKNAALITQDYAKANASYLGYKGNPKKREIDYAFDPSKLDSLEGILNESKKRIIGWEESDSESVAGYLQKLSFSAGIIKAVFFRNNQQIQQIQEEIESLVSQGLIDDDQAFLRFMEEINNPNSAFNLGGTSQSPQSKIYKNPYDVPPPPSP